MNKNEPLGLNEYQTLANVTRNKDISQDQALANYALGLTGEGGEVADIIKKHVFHGHTLDRTELIKELGDVMWYIATLASTIDVSLEQIAYLNLAKLQKRYPEGFDKNRSINRVENTASVTPIKNTLSSNTNIDIDTSINTILQPDMNINEIAALINNSMVKRNR